jgi:hypothetical protein
MLYVSWRELSELDAPDGRDDIAPYLSLVGGVCAGPNTSPDAVVEPPIQALPDTYVLVIEDEPAVSVGYGFGELLTDLLAALAINVAHVLCRIEDDSSLTLISEHEAIVAAVAAGKHKVEVEDFEFSYGLSVDGGRVICFAEGRIGYREWARRNGRLGDEIHSMDDRYDHDIDELMA